MSALISSVRTSPVSAKPRTGPSAADLETATELKGAIQKSLAHIRLGPPLTPEASPKSSARGHWTAPNGHRLIPVALSTPAPGTADGVSRLGLVDPKTNEFYLRDSGSIVGKDFFYGRLGLPRSTHFEGKTFSASDIKILTKAANGLSQQTMLNAMGAYEFHKLLKWTPEGPKASDISKKVFLKKDNFPDGYSYTGLVLKSDPNKFIIMRTGGHLGKAFYSQPIDVTRLPK